MIDSKPLSHRGGGVLLHVTSLPGGCGIGDLGPTAYQWVNLLAGARQRWWQILPLGFAGAGHSPYQCFSAFAGNPLLISPELLVKDGLLNKADLPPVSAGTDKIHFPRVARLKTEMLNLAGHHFHHHRTGSLSAAFEKFIKDEQSWLDDFSLFMAMREANPNLSWHQWPRDILRRKKTALDAARHDMADLVFQHQFTQFLFFRQLKMLCDHARARGVGLIGDLPIFVSPDSADVWSRPDLFQLDAQLRPRAVAGVPPDLFCRDGQWWGNPLYNWSAMAKDDFAWWVARVKSSLALADRVRIDHFRGFEGYWRIPASSPTARGGRWVKAPGENLFNTLRNKLGQLPLIAEDLGVITPAVERLRDQFQLPGMRVLQFAFGGGDSPFLPHNYLRNCVVYTATHDNDTTAGWFAKLDAKGKANVRKYTPELKTIQDAPWALTRLAWASTANDAIVPLQDLLGLGSAARMNTPGTATGNWTWRVGDLDRCRRPLDRLGELTEIYARATN